MSDDTPAVKSLHAVKTTRDDAHREAFIKHCAKQMHDSGLIMRTMVDEWSFEDTTGWLRTVWLEARGEEWGEGVEVGGGEAW